MELNPFFVHPFVWSEILIINGHLVIGHARNQNIMCDGYCEFLDFDLNNFGETYLEESSHHNIMLGKIHCP